MTTEKVTEVKVINDGDEYILSEDYSLSLEYIKAYGWVLYKRINKEEKIRIGGEWECSVSFEIWIGGKRAL